MQYIQFKDQQVPYTDFFLQEMARQMLAGLSFDGIQRVAFSGSGAHTRGSADQSKVFMGWLTAACDEGGGGQILLRAANTPEQSVQTIFVKDTALGSLNRNASFVCFTELVASGDDVTYSFVGFNINGYTYTPVSPVAAESVLITMDGDPDALVWTVNDVEEIEPGNFKVAGENPYIETLYSLAGHAVDTTGLIPLRYYFPVSGGFQVTHTDMGGGNWRTRYTFPVSLQPGQPPLAVRQYCTIFGYAGQTPIGANSVIAPNNLRSNFSFNTTGLVYSWGTASGVDALSIVPPVVGQNFNVSVVQWFVPYSSTNFTVVESSLAPFSSLVVSDAPDLRYRQIEGVATFDGATLFDFVSCGYASNRLDLFLFMEDLNTPSTYLISSVGTWSVRASTQYVYKNTAAAAPFVIDLPKNSAVFTDDYALTFSGSQTWAAPSPADGGAVWNVTITNSGTARGGFNKLLIDKLF